MTIFPKRPQRWVIFLVIIASCYILSSCSTWGQQPEPTPTPLPVSSDEVNPSYTVQRGDVIKELRAKGRIVPVTEQRLFFRSNGFVRQVYVRLNETVKAGQILADLEIGDLENQLAQAKINLETAQVELLAAQQAIGDSLIEAESALNVEKLRLELAEFALKNDNRLPQQISVKIQQEAVRIAELRLEKLERGVDPRLTQAVEIARLTVERLQAQIADSSIVAPFDGKILALHISPGNSVSAFNQHVISIYDPTQVEISAELSPDQLKELTESMAVMIKPGARSTESWEGTVRRLPGPYGSGNSGSTDGEDTTTRITPQFDLENTGLELGDVVEIQVILEVKNNVLWLPPRAVRNFEGRKFVVLQEGERQRRQNVVLGVQSPERVEIVEGLTEDQVVVSP